MKNQDWQIIDGIGPFFNGYERRRINWSKMIYSFIDVPEKDRESRWQKIREDMEKLLSRTKMLGYNTITIDDVVHLTQYDQHSAEIQEKIGVFSVEMNKVFDLIRSHGMRILVTSDVIPLSKQQDKEFAGDLEKMEAWFYDLIETFIKQYPQVDGVVIRLGEGDGQDVKELFHSGLYVKRASQANELIKKLLTIFEKAEKTLICRTWTVGAHMIGDLIWHRNTLARMLDGVESEHFILSLKYGETDFFRYLPLNKAFFRTNVQKIIEFQARREYEGAGEYPSFVGYDVEAHAKELQSAENMVGFSVWCQTGGWHAFKRRAFLDHQSQWVEQNTACIAAVVGEGLSVREWARRDYGEQSDKVLDFLSLNDEAVKKGLYLSEFGKQKWFFRRTRIPPLLHAYWDCLFINYPVRQLMRHFVESVDAAIKESEEALVAIRKMQVIAEELGWQAHDVEFMYDSFELIMIAKQYYLFPYNRDIREKIKAKKQAYKKKYPRSRRQRYRIKVDYSEMKFSLVHIGIISRVMLRKKRGYRLADHLFTLHTLRFIYRILKKRSEKNIPKFMRDSAMGVDVLFE